MVQTAQEVNRKLDSATVFDDEIVVLGLDDGPNHIEEFVYAVFRSGSHRNVSQNLDQIFGATTSTPFVN